MNDATPRKMTGSLLERAARVYDFEEHFRAASMPPVDLPPEPAPIAPPVADMRPVAPLPARYGPAQAIDRSLLAERGFLVPGAPVDALAEEFRLIKRQLLLTARSIKDAAPSQARSILVCSAKPGDGKTFCSINLALSLAAEKDVEIVLIDADFAKPDVMHMLGLEESPGLLDALADPAIDIESCVVATDVPQLSLLPAGTRTNDDTELLASDRTAGLLARLMEADPRRLLVFDSPPALAASPASVLAAQVGQVMMVVRADNTTDGDLREAVALLDGCEHIQLVLNSVTYAVGGRRFGTYYGQESDQ